jgi:hypothetical protein
VPNAAVAVKLDPERTGLLDQPPHHMSHWDEQVFYYLEKILPLKVRSVAFEPLAKYHIPMFLTFWANQTNVSREVLFRKLLINRITIPLLSGALGLGFRFFVRGHTLLVCLQKNE